MEVLAFVGFIVVCGIVAVGILTAGSTKKVGRYGKNRYEKLRQ